MGAFVVYRLVAPSLDYLEPPMQFAGLDRGVVETGSQQFADGPEVIGPMQGAFHRAISNTKTH